MPFHNHPSLFLLAGIAQLCVLVASAIVPFKLNWKAELASLKRLHRQMYWVYGGYIVLSIIAFGVISITNADELAAGGSLARAFCLFNGIFWGIRIALQFVFDVKEHLTTPILRAGYHLLTLLFLALTIFYLGQGLC